MCRNKIVFNRLFPLPPFKNNVLESVLNERTIENQIGKLSSYTALIPLMPYDIDITFETADKVIGCFNGSLRASVGNIEVSLTLDATNFENGNVYLVYDFVNCEVKITSTFDEKYMLLFTVSILNRKIEETEGHNVYYKDAEKVAKQLEVIEIINDRQTAALAEDAANIQKNANDITAANSAIQKNATDIEAANSAIQKNATDIEAANAAIEDNATDIVALNTDVAGLSSRVTSIEDNQEYQDLSIYANRLQNVEKTSFDLSNVVFIADEFINIDVSKYDFGTIRKFNKEGLCFDTSKDTNLSSYISEVVESIETPADIKTVFVICGKNDNNYVGANLANFASAAFESLKTSFVNAKIVYLFNPVYSIVEMKNASVLTNAATASGIFTCPDTAICAIAESSLFSENVLDGAFLANVINQYLYNGFKCSKNIKFDTSFTLDDTVEGVYTITSTNTCSVDINNVVLNLDANVSFTEATGNTLTVIKTVDFPAWLVGKNNKISLAQKLEGTSSVSTVYLSSKNSVTLRKVASDSFSAMFKNFNATFISPVESW